MGCKIINEHGAILISSEVISKIAGCAAMECYGIVGMAAKNVKDGFWQLLRRENLTKGIKTVTNEAGLTVELHIVVEYGTNIPAISETLVSTVKYRVETAVGICVEKVNVFVEGIRVDS